MKHTHLSGGAALLLPNGLPPEPDVMASGLLLQGWHSATGNKAGGNRTTWNGGESCHNNHIAHDMSEQLILVFASKRECIDRCLAKTAINVTYLHFHIIIT